MHKIYFFRFAVCHKMFCLFTFHISWPSAPRMAVGVKKWKIWSNRLLQCTFSTECWQLFNHSKSIHYCPMKGNGSEMGRKSIGVLALLFILFPYRMSISSKFYRVTYVGYQKTQNLTLVSKSKYILCYYVFTFNKSMIIRS